MTLQDLNQLIDATVYPQGQGPLITAPAFNVLLKNLTAEFSADAVFCFQVGSSYNPAHLHLAELTVSQLRDLLYNAPTDGYPAEYAVSIWTDEAAGHRHQVQIGYDVLLHQVVVLGVQNEDGEEQENHSAYPITGGSYSEADDAVCCFQVGGSVAPTHLHLAKLTVGQLRGLLNSAPDNDNPNFNTVSIWTDEAAGHRHQAQIGYNSTTHQLVVVSVQNEDGAELDNHSAYPILPALPAAAGASLDDSNYAKLNEANLLAQPQLICDRYGDYGTSQPLASYFANGLLFQAVAVDDLTHSLGSASLNALTKTVYHDGENPATVEVTLQLSGAHVTVPEPTAPADAATKAYVDAAVASSLAALWQRLGDAAAPAQPPLPADYSGFACFCKSYAPGADREVFMDVSGHNQNLGGRTGARFPYVTDSITGRQAYYATSLNEDCNWSLPDLSPTPGNYDIISAFRVESASETYLTLLADTSQDFTYGYTYLGLNCEEIQALYQTSPKGPVFRNVGQTVVVRHRLNEQDGASIEVNGQLVVSGVPYRAAKALGGTAFNQSAGHVLRGWHFAWGLYIGNMTDAQWAPIRTDLMRELGILTS
ncbi:hypothetical protein GCM10027422_43230 [Hymenobacter arcticus]